MKKLLCAILAVVLLLTLGACGGKKATHEDAGWYDIVSLENGGSTMTGAELAAEGETITLQLDDDGVGVLNLDGDILNLTWQDGVLDLDGDTANYTVTDGVLTLDLSDKLSDPDDTFVLVFKKSDGPAAESSADGLTPAVRPADAAETETPPAEEPPAEEPSAGVPAGDFEPVTGTLGKNGEYTVTILGAEACKGSEGEDLLRVYYDFTNDSAVASLSAGQVMDLDPKAEEDGQRLERSYFFPADERAEYGYDTFAILPGVTIRSFIDYFFEPDGTMATVTLSDEFDNEVTAAFDLKNLPDPPEARPIEPVEDPQFYRNYETSGASEKYSIEITGAEVVAGDSFKPGDVRHGGRGQVIRVFFNFTNNLDDQPMSCWRALDFVLFQDGVQLMPGESEEDVRTDGYFDKSIEPGESISCSWCWALRSDSPVEVFVFQGYYDVLCADAFNVN